MINHLKLPVVSIIVPAYNDPFLQKTIDSLLENAQGEIEIIVILDGYLPKKPLKKDPRVRIIKFKKNKGMRVAENAGLKAAKGKFIMKSDSHCAFAPGYDKILAENCKPSWLMVPRRYSLDINNWTKRPKRAGIDYQFFNYPVVNGMGTNFAILVWYGRKNERNNLGLAIDDTLIFQGSCWFANKKYFMKRVGFLDANPKRYTPFGGEQMEIGMKYWLGGGKVKVIKSTWYAHLSKRPLHYHQGVFTREYKSSREARNGYVWSTKHWMNNEEPRMKHTFSWLIEKFWPLPGWPEDRKLWVYPTSSGQEGSETKLCKLAYKYGVDKCPLIKHTYTPFYYNLLNDKRESFKKILELGIGYENVMRHVIAVKGSYLKGASLYMWRDFFPNAIIYGADILPELMFRRKRIKTFVCNQTKKEDLVRLIKYTGSDIDLLIDDGSHYWNHQIFTCQTLMPLLKNDVIYIIEDTKHPQLIADNLRDFDCEIPPFKSKYRDNALVVVRNKKTK